MSTIAPISNAPSPDKPARPSVRDCLALWILKLAKMRRGRLSSAAAEDCADFYEKFFEEKDLDAYEKDARMALRRDTIRNALLKHSPPPGRVLDIGCGLGDVLGGLPPGYQLFGTDYANFNVRVASRRLRGKAEITRASIYELPYADCSFDVGICLEVIEHIEHDEPAAREIARVLKPGGILIASVPYTYYWPQYLKLMGHFRHYTRQSFANLLGNCGLSVVDYLPNYPIWHQAYTRRYAMVRAEVETIGRLTGQRDLYSFKWPWSREPSLTRLAHRLEPLRLRDASLDYATRPTSTFLVVRKQSADASAKLGAA